MDDVIKNESMLRAENLTILNKLKNMPALKRKLFRDNVLKTYESAKFFSEFPTLVCLMTIFNILKPIAE